MWLYIQIRQRETTFNDPYRWERLNWAVRRSCEDWSSSRHRRSTLNGNGLLLDGKLHRDPSRKLSSLSDFSLFPSSSVRRYPHFQSSAPTQRSIPTARGSASPYILPSWLEGRCPAGKKKRKIISQLITCREKKKNLLLLFTLLRAGGMSCASLAGSLWWGISIIIH